MHVLTSFPTRKSGRRGVSILEVLVSAILLALVFVGMANVFVSGRRSLAHSRWRVAASELGTYFLDPLQRDVDSGSWSSNCLGAQSGCPASATLDGVTYSTNWDFSDLAGWGGLDGALVRKARVTINWTEYAP